MLAASSNEATFQFGEPINSAPLKEVDITTTKQVEGQWSRRNENCLSLDPLNSTSGWHNVDASTIDPMWVSGGSFSPGDGKLGGPTNGKVTVAKWATHWQTGERIADWVKGRTFSVAQTKTVKQSRSNKAYLLTNRGKYLGWLLEQDVDGSQSNANCLEPSYGTAPDSYRWHGPAIGSRHRGVAYGLGSPYVV